MTFDAEYDGTCQILKFRLKLCRLCILVPEGAKIRFCFMGLWHDYDYMVPKGVKNRFCLVGVVKHDFRYRIWWWNLHFKYGSRLWWTSPCYKNSILLGVLKCDFWCWVWWQVKFGLRLKCKQIYCVSWLSLNVIFLYKFGGTCLIFINAIKLWNSTTIF